MTFDLPVWAFAPLSLIPLLAALFWGAPLMALISELIGAASGKPFPARAARQLSRLGLWTHGAVWTLVAAAGLLFYPALEQSEFVRAHRLFLILTALVPFLSTIVLLVYDLTWKKARDQRGLHIFLGCLGNLGLKYGYWSLMAAALVFFRSIPLTSPAFLPPIRSAWWPLASLWPVMSLSVAAGMSLFYLMLRRNKDDWGRDYYRFAVPFLGKWQIFSGMGVLGVTLWLFFSLRGVVNLFLPLIFHAGVGAAACLGTAMLLSLCLCMSAHPMRLKGCMLAVCAFLFLHCGLMLAAVTETLNRYAPGWDVPTFMPWLLRLIY